MNIGDRVKIKDSCREELIILYNFSRGISGVNPEDINKKFRIKGFYGNNSDVYSGDTFYSLNRERFELVNNK